MNESKVKTGDIVAEWDPFTLPIIAQIDGTVKFRDLEEGITTREIVDESTGLSSNIVTDWKQQAKNQELVPRIEIHDKKSNGNVLVLENGSIASYQLTVDSIISATNDQNINKVILLQGSKNPTDKDIWWTSQSCRLLGSKAKKIMQLLKCRVKLSLEKIKNEKKNFHSSR